MKLSIANNSALKKVVIRTSLPFIAGCIIYGLVIYVFEFSFHRNWPFFGMVLIFAAFFISGLKRHIAKDYLEIVPDGITIGKYGTIPISKIVDCGIKNGRYGTALILRLQNGIELSIGPRNGFQRSATIDFQNFVDEFEQTFKKQLRYRIYGEMVSF